VPFATLGLPPVIVKGVRASGHVEPTLIQRKAIPVVLQGNDLIGAAQAGTGKTAAYLLPMLTRLLDGPRRLRGLVLAPTRELAAKVETQARDYARFTDIRITVVYPGAPLPAQEKVLREPGVDLLVTTPSRLLELHARGGMNFEDVEMMVLDEADRMVDMGFAPDLRKILKLLPETRQTLMFSVTMPPELNRVAKEALVEPIRIDLGGPVKPTAGLTQAIYPVPRDLKADLLNELISRQELRNLIVFTRTKEGAERLARTLERSGHTVSMLHSKLSHTDRERTLDDLRRGRIQVVVATDLASRGVDVDGISHVVNYEVPSVPEDYVHRIRRSGPGGGVGDAFTMMSPEEQTEVAEIERFLGRSVPRVMLPDFDYKMRPAEISKVVSYEEDGLRKETPRPAPVKTVKAIIPTRPVATPAVRTRPAATSKPAAPPPRPEPKAVPVRPATRSVTRARVRPSRKKHARSASSR
jgi:ATP-dependent RNA helicase RhlE